MERIKLMDLMNLMVLQLAKKYTDEVVEGIGTIKGAACTIQSITPIEGGNRVTFAWEDNEGETYTDTMDVMNGEKGDDLFVTPQMYGAVGDGVTDDTQAFLSAISASNVLYIPKGVYKLSQDEITLQNVTWFGDGMDKSVIALSGTASSNDASFFRVSGTNSFTDMGFNQNDIDNDRILYIQNNVHSRFTRCMFKVDNKIAKGYVDLYGNNQDIVFEGCVFDCKSTNSSGVNQVGGIWVREVSANKITDGVTFSNCSIKQQSIDECIAIWDWLGTVKNVKLINCELTAYQNSTAPHFCQINTRDSSTIVSNCTFTANYNCKSVVLKATGMFMNCKFTTNSTDLANGFFNRQDIPSTILRLNNCEVNSTGEVSCTPIYSNSAGAYVYNCLFKFYQMNSLSGNLYNSRFENTKTELDASAATASNRVFGGAIKATNCIFWYPNTRSFVYLYASETGKVYEFDGCQFYRGGTGDFYVGDTKNNTVKMKNCMYKGNFSLRNGATVDGYVINCITDADRQTIGNCVVQNNVIYDYGGTIVSA